MQLTRRVASPKAQEQRALASAIRSCCHSVYCQMQVLLVAANGFLIARMLLCIAGTCTRLPHTACLLVRVRFRGYQLLGDNIS